MLDTHPLVREWFGDRLKEEEIAAWRTAHSIIYDYLRRSTNEGDCPTLEHLEPLYQAISHGCNADRQREAFHDVYIKRIYRYHQGDGKVRNYAEAVPGGIGNDLDAMLCFFVKPYERVVESLRPDEQSFVMYIAGRCLAALGRLGEALLTMRAALEINLQILKKAEDEYNNELVAGGSHNVCTMAENLSEYEMIVGNIDFAIEYNTLALRYSKRTADKHLIGMCMANAVKLLHAKGMYEEAERQLDAVNKIVYFRYFEFLFANGSYAEIMRRLVGHKGDIRLRFDEPLVEAYYAEGDLLELGRAHFGMALVDADGQNRLNHIRLARTTLDNALESARLRGNVTALPPVLRARAALRRSLGDWNGAKSDINGIEEIAKRGSMRLILCDMALERAQLCFARIEACAPLNGILENSPPKPVAPDVAESARLIAEVAASLDMVRNLIAECGYHRRSDELVELEAVFRGSQRYADLPLRV